MPIGEGSLSRPRRLGERDNGRWPWQAKPIADSSNRSRLFCEPRNHHRL